MCTWVTETTRMVGSGKGPREWMRIESANVYVDHPAHAMLEHAVCIDLVGGSGDGTRVAIELSTESARDLILKINLALDRSSE